MVPFENERKENSQFSGAAALFRKKEMELRAAMASDPLLSPMTGNGKTKSGKSTTNKSKYQNNTMISSPRPIHPSRLESSSHESRSIWKNSVVKSPSQFLKNSPKDHRPRLTSPLTVGRKGNFMKSNNNEKKSLSPPPFVSPGRVKSSNDPRKGWKSSGIFSTPPLVDDHSEHSILSTPTKRTSKFKYPRVADQIISPMARCKVKVAPDITIQVNSEVKKSIEARKLSRYRERKELEKPDYSHLPEHVQKAREREDRLRSVIDEKEYLAASQIQAVFLGWYVRKVKFPSLMGEVLEKRRREKAILTIQKTFRMYIPRKRYLRIQKCRRRRERNKKEIEKIERVIGKMKKKTKQDLKQMKKDYESKKQGMKKRIEKQWKEDEENYHRVQKAGQDMKVYLREENVKLIESIKSMEEKQRILETQFEVLTEKSEEVSAYFDSLQKWVQEKNESIAKVEANEQKCKNRYLPMYRAELKLRNNHCAVEYRIKELYKARIKEIVKRLQEEDADPSLMKSIRKEMKACEKSLKEVQPVPVPEGLDLGLKNSKKSTTKKR